MRRKTIPWGEIAGHVVLLIGAAILLLPFFWMFVTSFRAPNAVFNPNLFFWPEGWDLLGNYKQAFTEVPLLRFMINGAVVVTAILVIQVAIAAPAGYALAKLKFPGRPILFATVLLGLLIPIQIPALPLYIALAKARLLDTYTALVLPFIISVFAIFLFRQFFKTYSDDVIDAARLDGFSELEIVWRIVLPAAGPAVAAFSIFSVTSHWNDLYWPLVVVNSTEMMTPPYGMLFFALRAEGGVLVGPLMAAAVVVVAPLVIIFLLAQQRFIRGLTMAGTGR